MKIIEHDFLSAVHDVQNSNVTKSTIDIMRRIFEHGLSSQWMNQATISQTGKDPYQTIVKIQNSLETVAQTDCSLACIFMADLLRHAGYANEVGDGIGLWLEDKNNNSAELERHLRGLASSDPDSVIRKYFQDICDVKYGK